MPGNFGKDLTAFFLTRVEQYHETFMPGNCGTQGKQLKIINWESRRFQEAFSEKT